MMLPMIRRRPAIKPSPGMAVPATVKATARRNVRSGGVVLTAVRVGAAGRAAGSCQLHVRRSACLGINIPFMRNPEWKPAQQYVPDRLNMRLADQCTDYFVGRPNPLVVVNQRSERIGFASRIVGSVVLPSVLLRRSV